MNALVVGMGKSGYSAIRYLRTRGHKVYAMDSRAEPPELARVKALGEDVTIRTGGFDIFLLNFIDLIVVSPGVAMTGPFFDAARARGIAMIGDIELFARAVRAPVAGITGTNGKSTVTTLVAQMAQRAGLRIAAGGNLGRPALDLLEDAAQLYVLELSSFQLETTQSLTLEAAAVLNVTPDHMDRYTDLTSYAAAKARIFDRCNIAIINLDDPLVAAMRTATQRTLSFSLRADVGADFALQHGDDGEWWLLRADQKLLALSQMHIQGTHNAANALAALALGEALGLPRSACTEALAEFSGLPHRSQWVGEVHGVGYVNDSKGTNVGATLAAIAGMKGPLVLIAGGEGKGQDFAPLREAVAGKVRAVVLIGRAARTLERALAGVVETRDAVSMEEAVEVAAQLAQPGDTVLLSPACASLDMFRDYAHRGDVFAEAVQRRSA
jgi:UDP-N-acetylmuramoylalanine--D-glutamate ligase